MLLGAIASAPLEAAGFLNSDDCLATQRAVEALGARVDTLADGTLRVTPPAALCSPAGPLDLGNSGTAMRLLAGVLAGRGIDAVLTGDDSLLRRRWSALPVRCAAWAPASRHPEAVRL